MVTFPFLPFRRLPTAAAIIVGWPRAGIESADVPGGWIGRTGTVKRDSGLAEAIYVLPSAVDDAPLTARCAPTHRRSAGRPRHRTRMTGCS